MAESSETDKLFKEARTPEDIKISFGKDIKGMFDGFNENFYGNNWFVLSTNEGKESSAICGVLNEIPRLNFKTTLEAGPVTALMDKMRDYTGRGGAAGAIGSATGTNMNIQLAGNYSVRYPMDKSFQPDGIKLEFTAWREPSRVFDPVCCPSNAATVISYLKKYATVVTSADMDQFINRTVQSADTGLSAVGPIIDSAFESAKAKFTDRAKNIAKDFIRENVPGSKYFMKDSTDQTQTQDKGFFEQNWENIKNSGQFLIDFADELLVRRWSDKQRITYGQEKFNQSLHRLDILRAGILDTYLIVAIKDWSWQLDQSALGERTKVSINCMIDQRMSQKRLRLYSDRDIFKY